MRGPASVSDHAGKIDGLTSVFLQVLDCSPTIVSDPGLTTANMQVSVGDCFQSSVSANCTQMVTIEVNLKEGDPQPEQHLDEGEHIERVLVPLSELYDKLHGK